MNKPHFLQKLAIIGVAETLGVIGLQAGAQAMTITPTTNVNDLINSLIAGNSGIIVTNATLNGQSLPTGEVSTGTFTNASGIYNGIGSTAGGIVISTGDVVDYADGPNNFSGNSTSYGSSATPAQEALLEPLSQAAFPHFDVTELNITFDILPGKDTILFDVVVGSEEFFEFVGSEFIDAFGLYVNGTNIAFANEQPLNINNPGGQIIPGTELDGIITENGNPVLNFSQFVGDGSKGNTLTFIIGDASDSIFDTTAYIANLGGNNTNEIPEPNTILGLIAVANLGNILKRKKLDTV